jgi:hypothetical protein
MSRLTAMSRLNVRGTDVGCRGRGYFFPHIVHQRVGCVLIVRLPACSAGRFQNFPFRYCTGRALDQLDCRINCVTRYGHWDPQPSYCGSLTSCKGGVVLLARQCTQRNTARHQMAGPSFTLPEWLAYRRVSRAGWYRLKAADNAPETYGTGRMQRITTNADRRWLKKQQQRASR